MINCFPKIFKDEILYSVLARYHSYSGNKNYKDTLNEVFCDTNMIATIEFPSRLIYFEKNISNDLMLTADSIIQNNTLFPFYAPFIPKLRKRAIIKKMKFTNGKSIKTQIGLISGGICKKHELMYCPMCIADDMKSFGEAYFHRVHQAEGAFVCPTHKCLLKNYPIKRGYISRLKFIKFQTDAIDDYNCKFIKNPKLYMLVNIAEGVRYLLNTQLDNYDQKRVQEKYKILLYKKGFITSDGRVRQREVYEAFREFYPNELLDILESNIDPDNEYNWLKVALRGGKRVIHPIRNILIILFLCNDIKTFFEQKKVNKSSHKYFPCLNPVCDNYRKLVAKNYSISYDYKIKENIITVYCDCGFVYSRKEKDDMYKLGRIKNFGTLWEAKLKKLIIEQHSIRYIARFMGCDPKTVVKYADKLGLKHNLNTSMRISFNENKEKLKFTVDVDKYKEDILNIIKNNALITRQQIRQKLYKQYMWLYKNDREWFDKNMPESKKLTGNNNNMRVDWCKRDNQLVALLKNEYKILLQQVQDKRITISLLGRRLNILSLLESKLNKLPETKKYLDEILETVEDFQLRRVNRICSDMKRGEEQLKKWKIVRRAGLKANFSKKVNDLIEDNLLRYNKQMDSNDFIMELKKDIQ